MSDSPERDAKLAFEQTQRALDVKPLSRWRWRYRGMRCVNCLAIPMLHTAD
jgi:hypothetical protein